MDHVVVDTDVFSYLFQGVNTSDYEPHLKGVVPVLSFTTVGELHFGAAKRGWGARRVTQLDEAIRRYLVVPFDEDLARLWGQLKAQAVRKGHPLGDAMHNNDMWICATAIFHDAPLLTNNVRHFSGFPGLSLLAATTE
ncbi:type II toxin-antitoxin system VapC family toxin [Actinoallomurus purpureus]|uniref:type II toxin-antitoxin system VapC family toxin n=1 Tax=Actinoallomurus purpureus TaxID=478114 RepID=UPI002092BCB8|nr:type II toxin-antitoxin system VapC family toxin [Actinoallomurus purpureus]MCO6006425.1 type II toxin-antitoxin system VapC family toxin [Actinoallomurus purpureus]